jgi:hypothetical protein
MRACSDAHTPGYDGTGMRRVRHGWGLTKKSWALLRSNRELFKFPVYAALSVVAVLAVTILPGLYLIAGVGELAGGVAGAAAIAVGLYLAIFVGIYFGVALAATADATFHGQAATVGDGMRVAGSRIWAIAGWAVVSAVVGTVLAAIQNIRGVGPIISSVLGTAWSLVTFLAVPVIALEGTGPIATVKRSASIFRERWASQVTGNVAIGGFVILVGVLPAIALIVGGGALWVAGSDPEIVAEMAFGAVLVAVGIAALLVSLVILRAMHGVFGVALYRFASDGEVTGGFTAAELESAVRAR